MLTKSPQLSSPERVKLSLQQDANARTLNSRPSRLRQNLRTWRWLVLPSKAVLSKLVAALYDAASDKSLWPVFLQES
jgi:hypothetical protein